MFVIYVCIKNLTIIYITSDWCTRRKCIQHAIKPWFNHINIRWFIPFFFFFTCSLANFPPAMRYHCELKIHLYKENEPFWFHLVPDQNSKTLITNGIPTMATSMASWFSIIEPLAVIKITIGSCHEL